MINERLYNVLFRWIRIQDLILQYNMYLLYHIIGTNKFQKPNFIIPKSKL